ncbi:Chitinase A1 precursor [Micromonospora sp. MW-13]|uniref:dioxygenase family protein n=1 Tax=unclassified Micromonospora TaxID=2617518 RepID=UPI000E44010E|nr:MULTISPECIES: carbohydrate-binding protein [unclassified Micromonospora]MCX4471161.1 dioxygenase [Micromonospora sp. NBC_01655]RGC67116.1 Chitinase A1 precursor [Micromonospora sp. MW-13]
MTGASTGADEPRDTSGVTRKTVLRAVALTLPAPLLIGGAARALATAGGPAGPALTPTPMCDDGDDPTPPQIEGPYFKPNSPRRTSLIEAGTVGTRLTLSGYVFGLGCQAIPNVLLDFWQADTNGGYDNTGYRMRGHQFTDASGGYRLTTIVPGLYPGRTRHIHVKVQAPGRPVLTTQLYFPGEPRNNTDSLFDPALLMTVRTVDGGREASFDFVLNVPQTPGPTTSPTGTPPPTGTWAVGTAYQAGNRVTYGGAGYRCLQPHTAQVGWEPPNTPALWARD